MTDRLAEIRGRLGAATSGPWQTTKGHQTGRAYGIHVPQGPSIIVFRGLAKPASNEGQANAEFIAHAPTDISWLLDEIERLRVENREMWLINENRRLAGETTVRSLPNNGTGK